MVTVVLVSFVVYDCNNNVDLIEYGASIRNKYPKCYNTHTSKVLSRNIKKHVKDMKKLSEHGGNDLEQFKKDMKKLQSEYDAKIEAFCE